KVFEDWLLVSAVLMPYERKPIAGHDQLRACQQPSDEAIKLLEQHGVFAEGEEFHVKLLETPRQSGHGCSMSTARSRKQRAVRPYSEPQNSRAVSRNVTDRTSGLLMFSA